MYDVLSIENLLNELRVLVVDKKAYLILTLVIFYKKGFRDLHMIILVFWFFSRHNFLISQILTFLYSMHFFQYTCKVKLLQQTSFHGYRLRIKSSNYKTLLIFPGSRIFSLFPEFQVIFDFLEFQKKAVCHPWIL